MKVLIDIKHPAQVHFFKNLIWELDKKGHEVLVTSRDKEMTNHLLGKYGIPHKSLSKIGRGKLGLLKELITRSLKIVGVIIKFKPDIIVEEMGIVAPIGWAFRIPTLVFYDSDIAKLTNPFAYFFGTKFITPASFRVHFGEKQMRYLGYQSLTHLHPKYFHPDKGVLRTLGLVPGETFTIVRFVSWGASHDFGHKGMSIERKREAIQEFEKYGKVFITSEKELPEDLEKYRLKINPENCGRDRNHLLDMAGWAVVLLSLLGVLIHGGTRVYIHFKRKG